MSQSYQVELVLQIRMNTEQCTLIIVTVKRLLNHLNTYVKNADQLNGCGNTGIRLYH